MPGLAGPSAAAEAQGDALPPHSECVEPGVLATSEDTRCVARALPSPPSPRAHIAAEAVEHLRISAAATPRDVTIPFYTLTAERRRRSCICTTT